MSMIGSMFYRESTRQGGRLHTEDPDRRGEALTQRFFGGRQTVTTRANVRCTNYRRAAIFSRFSIVRDFSRSGSTFSFNGLLRGTKGHSNAITMILARDGFSRSPLVRGKGQPAPDVHSSRASERKQWACAKTRPAPALSGVGQITHTTHPVVGPGRPN
jgi:hypothetical protein